MIGIFSNGCSTNRSGSPVMMQSALPERASSRYISSMGSRQTFTRWKGTINSHLLEYRDIIAKRTSMGRKYLSNLVLSRVSENSRRVFSDRIIWWKSSACLMACAEAPVLERAALMRTLQSTTTFIYSSFKSSSSSVSFMPCCSACVAENASRSLNDEESVMRSTINFSIISLLIFSILLNLSASSSLTSKVIVFITHDSINKYNEISWVV
jgi:hypothetical protein